jgi:hypothetical protein
VRGLVAVVDTWIEAVRALGGDKAGEVPGVTTGMQDATLTWAWGRSGEHMNRGEERIVQLVAAAPEASTAVGESIRRAYVLFYQATSRLNRQALVFNELGDADSEELAVAYHELEACVEALGPGVGEELRQAEQAVSRKPPKAG